MEKGILTENKILFYKWFNEIKTGERFRAWGKEIWKHKYLILISLILVIIATWIDHLAGNYVSQVANVREVPDLVLDNIRPYNLSILFVEGYFLVITIFFIYPLFFKVKRLHETISQFSFLITLRSFFMIFTHLKNPADAIPISFPGVFNLLVFENDLFFSGHTAVPFLGFLLFKESKIRYFFLIASILLGATALLMHRHYTIDILSAFFITYGSYKIGEKVIEKFEGGLIKII